MRDFIVALSALAVVALPAAAQSRAGGFARQVDSLAHAFLAKAPAASVSVAVVRGPDTLLMRAYGMADVAAKRVATANTIYEIASLTKQFTAAAIMRLVEQGKVRLDDDLSQYVPSFPLQGHRVTIRNLLTHTSGIHNYTAKPEWRAHWAEDLTPDSLVGFVARDTFDFAPGSKLQYSNTGYILLGMIIERASGRTYGAFLEDEFFRPLRLTRTHYCEKTPTDPNIAKGYSAQNGVLVPATYLSLTHPFSAGAICSSVADMARWEALFHRGQVVRAQSYQLMTSPTTLSSGARANYGFGLSIITMDVANLGSRRTIAHNGSINGYLTQQIYVPADSLAVVVLSNTDATPPLDLAVDIVQRALSLPRTARAHDSRSARAPSNDR